MDNLFKRQKIKLVIGLGLCAAIIIGLFAAFRTNSPHADVVTKRNSVCAATLPVVEILEQDKDAAEQDEDPATVLVKYTGDIKADATQMQVEIALTGEATYGATKDYTFTTGGTYSSPPEKLIVIFEKNETKQKLVTIKPVDDSVVEDNPDPETIKFRIIPQNDIYSIGENKETTANIHDNDVPTPTMRVQPTDPSASEQNKDPGTFTITSSRKVAQDTVVSYQVSGTATSNSDYDALPPSVTIKKDTTSATVTVTPIDDAVKDEPDETVILTLLAGAGYKVSSTSKEATVVITDNEGKPIVSITPDKANLTKGQTATFSVNRSGPTATALAVSLELGGTAVLGEYIIYPAATGNNVNVVIPAGASSANLSVMATGTNPISKSALLIIRATNAYSVGTPSAATVTLAANQISWLTTPLSLSGLFSIKRVQAAENTGIICGEVIDAKTGAKIQGATVNLYKQDVVDFDKPIATNTVKTDSTGKYTFKDVPKSEKGNRIDYTVEVKAGSPYPLYGKSTVNPSTEVNFRLVTDAMVYGKVTNKVTNKVTGKPVPGAKLRFKKYGIPWHVTSVTTDANGNYQTPPLQDDQEFVVKAGSNSGYYLSPQSVDSSKAPGTKLDLELIPAGGEVFGIAKSIVGVGGEVYATENLQGQENPVAYTTADPKTGAYLLTDLPLNTPLNIIFNPEGDKEYIKTMIIATPTPGTEVNFAAFTLIDKVRWAIKPYKQLVCNGNNVNRTYRDCVENAQLGPLFEKLGPAMLNKLNIPPKAEAIEVDAHIFPPNPIGLKVEAWDKGQDTKTTSPSITGTTKADPLNAKYGLFEKAEVAGEQFVRNSGGGKVCLVVRYDTHGVLHRRVTNYILVSNVNLAFSQGTQDGIAEFDDTDVAFAEVLDAKGVTADYSAKGLKTDCTK